MEIFKAFSFLILAHACSTVSGAVDIPVSTPNNEWWSHTILYQVYPRSFKDSNKDGVGDLKGITQKLDHFVELGIETLWIGPIFKSPMDDMGYDVENFYEIDPLFGTMADLEELVSEMKKRNLKLITDITPNHSSYKCEWFQKSIKKDLIYSDYYIWRNASNQDEVLRNSSIIPRPPNNWMSLFKGSAWTWNTERNQFYFHQFSSKQPDFNIRNKMVQQEIFNIFKFWMDKGIVGFRMDALKHLFETEELTDEPFLPGKEFSNNYDDMLHIYTTDLPEIFEIIQDWREYMINYTSLNNQNISILMTTESYSSIEILMQYYGNEKRPGAQAPFNFGLLKLDTDHLMNGIENNIKMWMVNMPKDCIANWVIENHDNYRIPTQFGPEMMPVFTALKSALPGIDVVYYGSEIGMHNTFVRKDQVRDPNNGGGKMMDEPRDFERTPMQWDDSINAGFTEEKVPWLPVNPNYYKVNVETQKKIPTSNYNFFKKMSQLRKTKTLREGGLQTFNISDSIYIVKRYLPKHEMYLVVMNLASETETVILSNVIKDIDDTPLYVYLRSENLAYTEGYTVSANSSSGNPLIMRPKSVVVLTDKFIEPESQSTKNSGNQISTTIISFIFGAIFARCAL